MRQSKYNRESAIDFNVDEMLTLTDGSEKSFWTRRVFLLGGPETNAISIHKKLDLYHYFIQRQTDTHTLQEVSFRHKLRKNIKVFGGGNDLFDKAS